VKSIMCGRVKMPNSKHVHSGDCIWLYTPFVDGKITD
jgi:hypothetical protein